MASMRFTSRMRALEARMAGRSTYFALTLALALSHVGGAALAQEATEEIEVMPPPPSDAAPTCASRAREIAASSVVRVRSGSSWGAGFVYHAPNHVVTAFSLIALGQPITIVARDGSHHAARLLASDDDFDLAVLELEHDLPGAQPLGVAPESSAIVGAPVIAMGHPFGGISGVLGERGRGLLRWSTSTGTIGAVNEDGIQADVALDEGHAGGPLLDCEGRVLGMIAGRGMLSSNIGLVARIDRADALIAEAGPASDFLGDLRLHAGIGGVLSIDESGRTAGGVYLNLGVTLFDRISWMNRVGILFGGVDSPSDDELSVDRTLVRIEGMLGYRFFIDIAGLTTLYIVPSLGLTVNHDRRETREVAVTPACTPDATESCIDIVETVTEQWSARPAIGLTFIFGGNVEIGYTLEIHVEDPVQTFHALNLGVLM
jgi:S1-C subfamily serine protease